MADFIRADNKKPQTLSIDNFRGVNLFSPVNGESTNMKNFKITPDLKLKKRAGTRLLAEFNGTIRGAWYGRFINDGYALYLCAGTQVYKYIRETNTKILLGNISNQSSGYVNIFYAYSRLYFLDGYDVYIYNGSIFKPVDAYIPIRFIDAGSTGNYMTNLEALNLLTNKYICKYKPINITDITFNHKFPVASIDKIIINGVDYRSDFTVTIDPSTRFAVIKFNRTQLPQIAPVEVYVTSTSASQRHEIFSNRYHAIFGEYTLPRLFLYGGNGVNKIHYTERMDNSESLYMIEGNTLSVGEEKNYVTSVIRQFDDLMIFTEGDAWSIRTPTIEKDTVYINDHYTYSPTMISSSTGNIGFGNVKSIENDLISIGPDGLYSWSITKIFDERNVKFVSEKLYKGMSDEFIRNSFTFSIRSDGEIWIAYDGEIWIYNYKLDVWYYYDNICADGLLMTDDVTFYYGNKIYIFDENCYTDNGQPIEAIWESNYMDFDLPQYTKNVSRMYLTVKDECGIDTVKIKSDRNTEVIFDDLINKTTAPMTFRRRTNITRCRFIRMSIIHTDIDNNPTIMNVKFAWVKGSEGR
jgi:hypothetical protein